MHDASLCPVFYDAVKAAMPSRVTVEKFDCHLNDEQFADAVVNEVLRLVGQRHTAAA